MFFNSFKIFTSEVSITSSTLSLSDVLQAFQTPLIYVRFLLSNPHSHLVFLFLCFLNMLANFPQAVLTVLAFYITFEKLPSFSIITEIKSFPKLICFLLFKCTFFLLINLLYSLCFYASSHCLRITVQFIFLFLATNFLLFHCKLLPLPLQRKEASSKKASFPLRHFPLF